jgi:hypothetical protein
LATAGTPSGMSAEHNAACVRMRFINLSSWLKPKHSKHQQCRPKAVPVQQVLQQELAVHYVTLLHYYT